MGSHLHTVKPVIQDFTPKVFSEGFLARLTATNETVRELKAMGHQVLSVDLHPDSLFQVPHIQVLRKAYPQMMPLQEYADGYQCDSVSGKCYASLGEVTVWWEV